MGFKCGIVGLPNVGKSTLFNAITEAGIEAANYPFCTIKPNVGIVPLPDARLQKLADIVRPQNVIPTTMEFVDIAGLVAGASKGEGLGNQFLANIRETQAIAHVVRCFENDDVVHVSGKVDPLSDVEVVNTELGLADLETIDKALLKASKIARSGDKAGKAEEALLSRAKIHLDSGKLIRTLVMDEAESDLLKRFQLLTHKPTFYVANVAEDGFENNPALDRLIAYAKAEGAIVVPICAELESQIAELSDQDKLDFLESLGLSEPGLDRVVHAGYRLLSLQTYFTAGVKEVRAWTIPCGYTAPQSAGVIHSDFERGFIRAEVISYADFIQYGGEQGAKDAGRLRLEGKGYVMCDGDVVHFRFNV